MILQTPYSVLCHFGVIMTAFFHVQMISFHCVISNAHITRKEKVSSNALKTARCDKHLGIRLVSPSLVVCVHFEPGHNKPYHTLKLETWFVFLLFIYLLIFQRPPVMQWVNCILYERSRRQWKHCWFLPLYLLHLIGFLWKFRWTSWGSHLVLHLHTAFLPLTEAD